MADQTGPRPVNALGGIAGNLVLSPTLAPIGPGIAANTTIYSGAIVGLDGSGNMVNGDAATCVTVMGLARANFINTTTATPPTTGLAGAINGTILVGPYSCLGDGSITASTPFGTDVFVVDNQTVSTSDGGGTRLRAGYFVAFDTNGNPVVEFGVASPTARAFGASGGFNTRPYFARAVMTTTAVASYTGSGTSTLTAGSNAALVAQDGVTMAAGDVILLQGGTLGSLAITAKDTGPYVITSLGSASAPFVFTRPDWWVNGQIVPTAQSIQIGTEGTLFQGSLWTSWASPGCVIGTTDPALYPDRVIQSVALTASAVTISNVPIRSATKSSVTASFVAAGGTVTGTVGYGGVAAPTAGYIGTASSVVDALQSGMTKNGTSDTSTVCVIVENR
jgi:hypothetical protein